MNSFITILVILLTNQHYEARVHVSQLQHNNQRQDVRDTCEKLYGNFYFTAKHGQTSHFSHPQEVNYLKELISCGYAEADVPSGLKEAVFHVWAKLGRLHHSTNISEQLENQTSSLIESYFKNVSIWDPWCLTEFWKHIVQGPILLPPHAGDNNDLRSRRPPSCIRNQPQNHQFSNHQPPNHKPRDVNITSLFEHVLTTRIKKDFNPDTKHAFKYYNLARTNRLMCVYLNDIISPLGMPLPPHEQITLLIKYILMGFTFKDTNELCPAQFLQNIYKYGALSKDTILTERELNTLIHNLQLLPGDPTEQPIEPTRRQPNDHRTHSLHQQASKDIRQNSEDASPGWVHFQSQESPHIDLRSSSNRHSVIEDSSTIAYTNVGRTVDAPLYNKCLSAREIMHLFKKDRQHIDGTTFLDICPVLLEQVLPNSCRRTVHLQHSLSSSQKSTPNPFPTDSSGQKSSLNSSATAASNSTPTEAPKDVRTKAYLYGSLSVFLVSLCSLLGAVFLKFGNELIKHYLMGSLLALAVGCLVADAVLHLLPEISGMEENEKEDVLLPKGLQKLCALIACIYAFFNLELYLSSRSNHGHSHGPSLEPPKNETIIIKKNGAGDSRTPSEDHHPAKFRKIDNIMVYNIEGAANNSVETIEMSRNTTQQTDVTLPRVDNQPSNDSVSNSKIAIAWMVIIGDGIHNFADGLAIGAAFTLNFTKGLSTSITVLCHELPHELGDFAVLVASGMSIKRAMLFNFLSSLTAFAGLYIGLALGDQPEACQWIFSAGAGMFLYVAMADLIPEIKAYFKKTPDWKMFIGQNLGWLIGYLGMLLLAMFEEKLGII